MAPRDVPPCRSRSSRVWSAICLLVAGAGGWACGPVGGDAEQRATDLLLALQQGEVSAVSDFFVAEALPEGWEEIASGPLVFREVRVLRVSDSDEGGRGAKKVSYEATISDYPSALFNFLVRSEVLAENHRLRPYEGTVTLPGELVWRRDGRRWRVVEPPPPHEPVGLAFRLAALRGSWREGLPGGAQGVSSLGGLLSLMSETAEPNHMGALERHEVLRQIGQNLTRAASTAGASLLDERFLPAPGESVSRGLEALAVLDRFLSAWWRGEPEREAQLLSGVLGGEIEPGELVATPVQLHAFDVLQVEAMSSTTYAIATELKVSDPASVVAVSIAPQEITDPRSYIQLIDEGTEVRETFVVEVYGSSWLLDVDDGTGVVGYAVRSGRLAGATRWYGPLSSDISDLSSELAFRLTFAHIYFDGLRFAPLEGLVSGDPDTELVEAVVTRVMEATRLSRTIGQFSTEERCFYLGRKLAEFVTATMLQPLLTDEGVAQLRAELREVEQQIGLFVRSLRLGVASEDYDQVLVRARLAQDPSEVIEAVGDLRDPIRRRHGSHAGRLYMLGLKAGMVQLNALLAQIPDPDVKALAVDYLGELLLDLAVDLTELPGVRPSAVQGVGDLLRRVQARDTPTVDDVDALGDYDWYFSQP